MPDGIGLISGGLDSLLAMRLLMEQDLNLLGLVIDTGFSGILDNPEDEETFPPRLSLYEVARIIGFPLKVVQVHDKYWDMIKNPVYGYGKHVNPCLDCRILMLKAAARVMREENAQFVFTGEVLGQRPKSQLLYQLRQSEEDSGLQGRLLRPLSAKVLPPTIPEENGLVDRSKLEGITGRSRKHQMKLAARWGLEELSVAGGANCYLINEAYSDRMNDLFRYKGKENVSKNDLALLRVGRHFRLTETLKLIVSRNKQEHLIMWNLTDKNYYLECLDVPGAIGILSGESNPEQVNQAAEILGRYSKAKLEESIKIAFKYQGVVLEILTVSPQTNRQILDKLLI